MRRYVLSLVSAGGASQKISDECRRARLNGVREHEGRSLKIKVGAIVNQRTNVTIAGSKR
jgi:hypothetical protein